MHEDDGEELQLRDYLSLLWRRKVVVILIFMACLSAAVGFSLVQTPTYRATAEVLVHIQNTVDPLETARPADAERLLNNEVRLIESQPARDAVEEAYNGSLDVDEVTAQVAEVDADVVEVSMTSGDPDEAATLVNAYVDTYIEFRRQQRVNEMLAASTQVRETADALQQQIAAISQPLVALDAQIAAADEDDVPDLQVQRQNLATQLASQLNPLRSQLALYQEQLDRLELSAGLRESGSIEKLTTAEPPESPVSPQPVRNAALAAVLGLLLGIGGAFLVEQLDDSVKHNDLLEALTGLPTFGIVPRVAVRKGASAAAYVVTATAPKSVAAEAYRSLRTSVKFLGVDRPLKVVQITSPSLGEGKSVTAANLAVALAQAGDRVIVVGCDLRRPRIDAMFGVPPGPGLTGVLMGEAPLPEAIFAVPDMPRLAVLRTGTLPPNPSELLGTKRTAQLLEAVSSAYDVVLLDCPPVLPVTDALVLAREADATLLVVAARQTSRRATTRAIDLLRQVNAPLVGTILNEASEADTYGTGSYTYYAYGHRQARRSERKRRKQAELPENLEPIGL
ncbi:MAG: polysaccharide biosynthesis tyrosine autokinase [Acidimicrobiales bacterium]